MKVDEVCPVFRIFDVAKAEEFYLGFLGMALDWRHAPEGQPQYWQVSRWGLTLHLTEHHGDCTPGSLAFVTLRGLAELQRELAAKDYPYNRPGLDPAPWGGTVMEVTDPFQNRLRFADPDG